MDTKARGCALLLKLSNMNPVTLSFRGKRNFHFVCVICSRICVALDAHTTAQKGQTRCHGLMPRALIGGTTTAGQRAALPLPKSCLWMRCSGRGPLVCAQTLLLTGTTQRTHLRFRRASGGGGLAATEDCFFPMQKKSCVIPMRV